MHVIYCNLLKCHVVVTHCNLPHIMLVNKVTFIIKKKKERKFNTYLRLLHDLTKVYAGN